MGGSDSAVMRKLSQDFRCLPPVERMTPGISSWTCHKSLMPRYSWSRAARKNFQKNYWYRSASVRPVALDQHAHEIYVARATIPDESGFSQADLAGLLEQTKKQVSDLERITGTITQSGIALQCVGKGGRASGRLVLNPDQSGDLKTILRHSVEDFRLGTARSVVAGRAPRFKGRDRNIDPKRPPGSRARDQRAAAPPRHRAFHRPSSDYGPRRLAPGWPTRPH